MGTVVAVVVTLVITSAAALAPAAGDPDSPVLRQDFARWVNPFIGTKPGPQDFATSGGGGNTFPGAAVPFGMVQWSPDTATQQPGGYFYDDNRISGFSLTHLSGAGCPSYQDIPFMPVVGEVTSSPATDPNRYLATFTHANETVSAGQYQVRLDNRVQLELTATQRTGAGRFTYPAGKKATLLVNVSGSVMGTDDAQVSIDSDTISGWASSGKFCGAGNHYRVYFEAKFDRPFASIGTWEDGTVIPAQLPQLLNTAVSRPRSGAFVSFDTSTSLRVAVRVGLSFVSVAGAHANLVAENPGRAFDDVAAAARAAWNARLSAVVVDGGTDERKTTFYTALYHALLQPSLFSDSDGKYPGIDEREHSVAAGHAIYSNFSGWDIYRSEAQLLALIAPNEASDIAASMTAFAEQGGSWDRWTVANGFTGGMNGDPYHIIVSSMYAFGAKDFDAHKALRLMLRGATEVPEPTQGYQERPGLAEYKLLGYVPVGTPGVDGSAATTLEYTSADFAIAQLAHGLDDDANYKQFMMRAQNWQNLYNAATGYLQPRHKDGSFVEPFEPAGPSEYTEGNGAQYTWMVPYDEAGLIAGMGGNQAARDRLDTFFTKLNGGPEQPYAWLGNEPTLETPFIYSYAGAPYKTQEIVRRALTELYQASPDGLAGNDDLGEMSSWFVWAAAGLYPMIPGRSELVLASPLFNKITFSRPSGQRIVITAPAASASTPYVTGLVVSGQPSTRSWLPESFVARGGTVEFALSSIPDTRWGADPADAPPSFRDGEAGQQASINIRGCRRRLASRL